MFIDRYLSLQCPQPRPSRPTTNSLIHKDDLDHYVLVGPLILAYRYTGCSIGSVPPEPSENKGCSRDLSSFFCSQSIRFRPCMPICSVQIHIGFHSCRGDVRTWHTWFRDECLGRVLTFNVSDKQDLQRSRLLG